MTLLIVALTDLLHFLKIFIICDVYLVLKRRKCKKSLFYSTGIIICTSLIIQLSNNINIDIVIYLFSIALALYVLYKEKLLRIAITSIWTTFMLAVLDIISKNLVNSIFSIFNFNLKNAILIDLFVSIVSLLVVAILGILIKSYNKNGIRSIKTRNIFLFTVMATVEAVILLLLDINSIGNFTDVHIALYKISYFFMVIGVFIQLAAVVILMVSRNVHREKEELATQFLNEQINHYKYLEHREKETKKFRHDIKNHMCLLKTFFDNKDYDKFDEYFKRINEHVDKLGNKVSVNNDIVDAVINRYYSQAQKYDIAMDVKGHFPKKCNISIYDLCTIFSNLLSNAIEAARESDRKEIEVSCMFREQEEIIIVVSNFYKDILKDENGNLITKKKDKKMHGLGLENVSDFVSKNNGYITINDENNKFVVSVVLKT